MRMSSLVFAVLATVVVQPAFAQAPPDHAARIGGMTGPAKDAPATHSGPVAETIAVNDYVYIRATENGQDVWLAAPKQDIAKGKTIHWADGTPMANFHSPTLNRTFPMVLFLSKIDVDK